MISDEKLKKICLAVAIIGIVGLVIFTYSLEPVTIRAGEVTDRDIGRYVQIDGQIKALSINDGNIFIDFVDETGEIKIIMFERDARGKDIYDLKTGNITVIGKIILYKSQLEIQAEKIEEII